MPFQPLLPFDAAPAPDAPAPAAPVPDAGPPRPRLILELERICRERPLEEKILVAPTLSVGHQLVERLAREGAPWVHVRVETPRTLAHGLVGPELAREGTRLLSRAQALALVEQACGEALEAGSYFGGLKDRPGLHRALQSALEELSAAGLSLDVLPPSIFADRQKHRELREVFRRHERALEAGRAIDRLGVIRRAIAALDAKPPDPGALYLMPAATDLSALEEALIEKLAVGNPILLAVDPPEAWSFVARGAEIFRATGEENEIREVLRRMLAGGTPFEQVEILHTDSSVYPALVWELSREHEIPCTFSEGIAASFTRPGRAAIAFLEWIRQDFAADVLREALVSGSLRLPPAPGEEAPFPARAAARELREASIGWTRERHRRGLERRIAELSRPEKPGRREEDSPADAERRAQARERRKQAALAARDFVWRALDLAPRSLEERAELPAFARSARQFVQEYGRVADELDAAAATALDTLFAELEELPSPRLTAAEAADRLREAVSGLSVAADRPRPGRVHVAPFRDGGYSGRPHTFLVGLDEGRHPGRDLEDPILLDEERARINEASTGTRLSLQRERPRETAASLRTCIARLRGHLTASYSSFGLRNLSQAGEPAPSPFLLELYRERSGRRDADYGELAKALPVAAGFVPEPERALDETEWWLARLRGKGAGAGPAEVRSAYPWLADGERAQRARASGEFTVYDGWVRSGTPELDPRGSSEPFSATRIQALASCPFSYFLKHVLRLEPPEDLARDPARWLEPMDEGSLLHEVFRIFLEEITEANERPNLGRHLARIEKIAAELIEEWKDRRPVHSRVAFDAQRKDILFACRTFLRLEQAHCLDVAPRFFEVAFGQDRPGARSPRAPASREPVEIAVGGGKRFRLRGSIDRVDEAPDGTFHVWDYKTGSAWAVRDGAGLRGGRQVQPALYAMAFEALLERSGKPGSVSRTGYFFPGRKGEGQRILAPLDPAPTRDVLRTLFDLLAAGLFPHATSSDGCRHCDFEAVCGGPRTASEQSDRKLAVSRHPGLIAFRDIHVEKD